MAADTEWLPSADWQPQPYWQPEWGPEWRQEEWVPTAPAPPDPSPDGWYPTPTPTPTPDPAQIPVPDPILDTTPAPSPYTAGPYAAEPHAYGQPGRHRALRHRDVSGGWLRPAVFGAMDGLVTNASLIAGVGGSGAANHTIALTGLAGLVAGAFSMATGEYISVSSQNDLTEAEIAVEELQHSRNPRAEERELAEVFAKRGVTPDLAEAVARQISADPRQALAVHVREELGVDPDDLPSPWTAAGASFASFTVGALIPLLPYLIGFPAFLLALVLAGLAAFAGGAAVARLTGRPVLVGGLRQFALGALATGMTFVVGHLLGTHLS